MSVDCLSLLKEFVDAGPFGHREESWSDRMLTEFIRPQLANPDPFDGPPHPTCSACSRDNDPATTKRAHEKFDLWFRAKQLTESETHGIDLDGGGQ